MRAQVISVPYVVGREAVGMGAGPLALAPGVADRLGGAPVQRMALSAPLSNEAGAAFDLNRQVAEAVGAASREGALPVVLTGNCHTQQAVSAGVGVDGLGLVWLDCHGDLNTPETTSTGFFDGCALSMVLGDCWRALCATVPGAAPLAQEHVVLVGVRDLDAGERERLAASQIAVVAPEATDGVPAALAALPDAVERVSLHVDLDVLDPDVGRANQYAVAPGLSREQLRDVVGAVLERHRIAALTLSAYDPAFDPGGGVRDAALDLVALVAERARVATTPSR